MYVNGCLIFVVVDDLFYKYDLDGDGVLELYECEFDFVIGFLVYEVDYIKYKGFQGDVYFFFIEMGIDEYELWNIGVLLGFVYIIGGIQKIYKYIYIGVGDFIIIVVVINVGDKDYKGIDYSEERSNFLDDYSYKRVFSSVKVLVKLQYFLVECKLVVECLFGCGIY